MTQIRDGLASVTNGSAVVAFSDVVLTGNALPGHLFSVGTEGIWYEILTVDSATQVTLTSPYGGITAPNVAYVIHQTFTDNLKLPYPGYGDKAVGALLQKAFVSLDGALAALGTVNDIVWASAADTITLRKGVTTVPSIPSGLIIKRGALPDAKLVFRDDLVTPYWDFGTASVNVGELLVAGSPLTIDPASETVAGKVELATAAESITGTSNSLAVHPAGLKATIDARISALVDSSPSTLDTLNELAAALGDDPNFATTITTLIGTKATGPASATDNAIARFDATTGKLLQDSGATIDDSGNLTAGPTLKALRGSAGDVTLSLFQTSVMDWQFVNRGTTGLLDFTNGIVTPLSLHPGTGLATFSRDVKITRATQALLDIERTGGTTAALVTTAPSLDGLRVSTYAKDTTFESIADYYSNGANRGAINGWHRFFANNTAAHGPTFQVDPGGVTVSSIAGGNPGTASGAPITVYSSGAVFAGYAYGSFANIIQARRNGTVAVPTDVINGDRIGNFNFRGLSAGVENNAAQFICEVDAAPVGVNVPTRFLWFLNDGTSTAERMRLSSAGHLGLGNASPGFRLDVRDTTDNVMRISGGGANALAWLMRADNGGTAQEYQFGVTKTTHGWGAGFYLYSNTSARRDLFIDSLGSMTIGGGATHVMSVGGADVTHRMLVSGGATGWSAGLNRPGDSAGTSLIWATYAAAAWTSRMSLMATGTLSLLASQTIATMTGLNTGALVIRGGAGAGEFNAIDFATTGSASVARIAGQVTGSGSFLHFGVSNSYAGGVTHNVMTIRYDQRVGINTTAPAAPLDIRGPAGSTVLQVSDGTYGTFGLSFSATYGIEFGSTAGSPINFKSNNIIGITIATTGYVGMVGATNPTSPLQVGSTASRPNPGGGYLVQTFGQGNSYWLLGANSLFNSAIHFGDPDSNTVGKIEYVHNGDRMEFHTNGAERMRIDSSGNVVIGHSGSVGIGASSSTFPQLQVHGGSSGAFHTIYRWSADTGGPNIDLFKSRGATIGTRGVVQAEDVLGAISWRGDDGTHSPQAAFVRAVVDGTPGALDMPARLEFGTTSDGASASTVRLTISSTVITSALPVKLPSYTVATVPSAATAGAGSMIYVSNGTSNKRLAISDGTNWRWPDGAVIS